METGGRGLEPGPVDVRLKGSIQRLAGLAVFLLLGGPLWAQWSFEEPVPLAAPEGLAFYRQTARNGEAEVVLRVVSFSTAAHTFAVMDNPEGAFNLGSASKKRGVLASVNGGYFQPDRTPLGLVIRQGAVLHGMEKSRLLSGLVVAAEGRVALLRTGEFKAGPAVREALQAGPFLVDGGKPVAGLNATRSAARTVVFTTTAGGRAGVLTARNATLAETGALLAAVVLPGGARINRALNLDGGTSSALWVRGEPAPYYEQEWKSVRNYLGIVPQRH